MDPPLLQLLAYSEYVACPVPGRLIRVIQTELHVVILLDVDCQETDLAGTVPANLGRDTFVYCSGEDESSVVVGVFTYQVYASGREIEVTFMTEHIPESVSQNSIVHDTGYYSTPKR